MESKFSAPRRALKGFRDQRGQDLIEYALMAGFVAVAAGAILPSVARSIELIFVRASMAINQSERKDSDGTCKSGYMNYNDQCATTEEYRVFTKDERRR